MEEIVALVFAYIGLIRSPDGVTAQRFKQFTDLAMLGFSFAGARLLSLRLRTTLRYQAPCQACGPAPTHLHLACNSMRRLSQWSRRCGLLWSSMVLAPRGGRQ